MSFLAYKGFERDLTCRGFQYDCCKRLVDVFNYYSPRQDPIEVSQSSNRFCLVEVCGDVDIEEGVSTNRKYATNSITIVRELSIDEMIEILDREAEIANFDRLQTESFANDFRARVKDKRKN